MYVCFDSLLVLMQCVQLKIVFSEILFMKRITPNKLYTLSQQMYTHLNKIFYDSRLSRSSKLSKVIWIDQVPMRLLVIDSNDDLSCTISEINGDVGRKT